jgi:hypothetical protein
MGCTGSKPVDAIDPESGEKKTDPATITNGNGLMGDMAPTAAPTVNGSVKVAQLPPAIPPPPMGSDDVHWNRLWDSHRTFLLDPADIHATIEDLMARSTNKLSGTEINLIQRKVRRVIRKSGSKDAKKGIPFAKSSSGSDEDRLVAERQHLLTSNAVQHILPALATSTEPSTVTPATSIFLLLLYSHESMWDKVAETAVANAKAAGIIMDVNVLQPPTSCPAIPKETSQDPKDLPAGVSLQSLTFMIGLALRKCLNVDSIFL